MSRTVNGKVGDRLFYGLAIVPTKLERGLSDAKVHRICGNRKPTPNTKLKPQLLSVLNPLNSVFELASGTIGRLDIGSRRTEKVPEGDKYVAVIPPNFHCSYT